MDGLDHVHRVQCTSYARSQAAAHTAQDSSLVAPDQFTNSRFVALTNSLDELYEVIVRQSKDRLDCHWIAAQGVREYGSSCSVGTRTRLSQCLRHPTACWTRIPGRSGRPVMSHCTNRAEKLSGDCAM